jgi:hypothetical protein
MRPNFILLSLALSFGIQQATCLEEEIIKNGDARVENGEELVRIPAPKISIEHAEFVLNHDHCFIDYGS